MLLSSRRVNVVCLLFSLGGTEGQVIDTIYLSGTLDASFGIWKLLFEAWEMKGTCGIRCVALLIPDPSIGQPWVVSFYHSSFGKRKIDAHWIGGWGGGGQSRSGTVSERQNPFAAARIRITYYTADGLVSIQTEIPLSLLSEDCLNTVWLLSTEYCLITVWALSTEYCVNTVWLFSE